jgi:hypothetical protein
MKRATAIIAALALLLLAACDGADNAATEAKPAAQVKTLEKSKPMVQRSVEIPTVVAQSWKAVLLEIEDKAAGTTEERTVDIGETVSHAGLEITVNALLPDFVIRGPVYTSRTNEPNNPAAWVTVKQGGLEVYSDWISKEFPDMHPFRNKKAGIRLKEAVKN